jgi:hypothetical protein
VSDIFIDLETRGRRFIDAWAVEFKRRVEEKTPVKSGDLQKGYGITRKKTGFEFWNVEDYFKYVEQGTIHMAPRRMVGTTLLEEPEITELALNKAKSK